MTIHADLLRLNLDPIETMEILGISLEEYEKIYVAGSLRKAHSTREYFEPVLAAHSFWDIVAYKLTSACNLTHHPQRELVDDVLDYIAACIEDDQHPSFNLPIYIAESVGQILARDPDIHLSISNTDSRSDELILEKKISEIFLSAHNKFIQFCFERMVIRGVAYTASSP